jgi:hypothetical protein
VAVSFIGAGNQSSRRKDGVWKFFKMNIKNRGKIIYGIMIYFENKYTGTDLYLYIQIMNQLEFLFLGAQARRVIFK